MSRKEAKLIYETMKENGDLFELFSGMTGDWLTDKKNFMIQYDQNQSFINSDSDLNIENLL